MRKNCTGALAMRAGKRQNGGRVAPWLNWIEQPPPKGQVIGSNPIGVTTRFRSVAEHHQAFAQQAAHQNGAARLIQVAGQIGQRKGLP